MSRTIISLPIFFLLFFHSAYAQSTLPTVQEVYQVFQNKCASCHNHATPAGGLDLEGSGLSEYAKAVYVANQELVNKNPGTAHAASIGDKLVYPGRPDRSFLFRKINGGLEPTLGNLHIDEGAPMPDYPSTPLTDAEKELIRQWILYGAKTNGVQFDKTIIEGYYAGYAEQAFPEGPPPAPAPGEGFQIKMGPFFLPPGGEVEFFQKYELNLPQDVEVNRIDMKFSGYSHHFIIYNFTGNGANSIPAGLRLNANHSQISLTAAVQQPEDLLLPASTAFSWPGNLVLDLNSHYINYSLVNNYQCEVYLNIYTQPVGTAEQEMYATLLVNGNIPIPNDGDQVVHTAAEYQTGADSIYIWGLMGHTHKYGTGYKVWARQPNGQKGDMIYDAACPLGIPGCVAPYFDYQHIPLRYWNPLLPLSWNNGIIHEASWVNTGPESVNFGPTSDDEMMVLIAFYTLHPLTVDTEAPADIESEVRILPNPATDWMTVVVGENSAATSMVVTDVAGRVVRRIDALSKGENRISLAGLTPGVYFYATEGQSGRLVVAP